MHCGRIPSIFAAFPRPVFPAPGFPEHRGLDFKSPIWHLPEHGNCLFRLQAGAERNPLSNMKPMKNTTCYLAALIIACSTSLSHAAVLADNLAETRNGNVQVTNTRFEAQSFTTTATDFLIQSVTISVQKSAAFSSGTLELFFFDATGTGGTPGSSIQLGPVASVAATSLTTTIDANHTFSLSNYALAPSTTYFVVLAGSGLSDGDEFQWNFTNSTSGTGFPSSYSRSDDSGSSWSAVDTTQPQKMSIAAVPEPSTFAVSAIGTALLCCFDRRRRRKSSHH